jgi:hypothetical protein
VCLHEPPPEADQPKRVLQRVASHRPEPLAPRRATAKETNKKSSPWCMIAVRAVSEFNLKRGTFASSILPNKPTTLTDTVKYGRFMAAIIASKVLREPSFLKVRPMRTFAALSLVLVGTSASAQEMKVPQTTSASVDWPAVRASIQLPAINRLPPIPDGPGSESGLRIASEGGPLGRLNQSISPIFPAVALSTVPVLMPLDMPRYLSDLARNEVEKTDVYTSGFKSKVFVPGRAGYDAAFRYTPNKNVKPIEVQISGSSITYELTTPANSNLRNRSRSSEKAVPVSQDLVSKYPGIRKLIHENYIQYAKRKTNHVMRSITRWKFACDRFSYSAALLLFTQKSPFR